MHEIPPVAEQALRSQGVSDAELDELRRTGSFQRADTSGASIQVQFGSASMGGSPDGVMLQGTTLPPEAIEKLKRFHRFIPAESLDQLERATGQDIDGDGRVGRDAAGGDPTNEPLSGTVHAHALPSTAGTPGPFVDGRRTSRMFTVVLVAVALLALVVWLATR